MCWNANSISLGHIVFLATNPIKRRVDLQNREVKDASVYKSATRGGLEVASVLRQTWFVTQTITTSRPCQWGKEDIGEMESIEHSFFSVWDI